MTSKLGCHWQRVHPDRDDMPHIAAMQYKSVKLFKDSWNNADFCRDLLTVLPGDSYILARDHALSEQKEDMWRDAVAAGIDHANQWINKVHNGEYHLPLDRTFFLGINEPDATNGDRNKIDLYTESFLRHLQANGLRGGAFNFSTGHPRTVDGTPNTAADYSVFERSHRAIVDGHHIGVLHIYGTGAVPCAPGHYDRLHACDWLDVEWVVGEMAVDEHVIGGGEHFGFHKFFDGRLNDYCAWLDTLIMGINDSRIHSYQVFTYDFAHPWSEFDIHPIRHALESYQWQHMAVAATPPSPGPAQPRWVTAPSGVNVREKPTTGSDILQRIPYGEKVESFGVDTTSGALWRHVVSKDGVTGWMMDALLSPTPPSNPGPTPPVKPPTPTSGALDPRVLEAVLKVESGGNGFGSDGALLVRLEAHIFKTYLHDDTLWAQHFSVDPAKPWTNQQWRADPNGAWLPIHTGRQVDEYAAIRFARASGPTEAMYQSISMGAAQIMGFNYARLGYPNAEAMYKAFQRSINAQLIAFINYMLSDPALVTAIRSKDWAAITRGYNGTGDVESASAKYQQAYQQIVAGG